MTHTVTRAGRTVDLDRLNQLVRVRAARYVPITSVFWIDRRPRSPETGFDPNRYVRADTSVPALVLPSGELIDGRHRLCKLADLGGRVAPVRTVTEEELERCTH